MITAFPFRPGDEAALAAARSPDDRPRIVMSDIRAEPGATEHARRSGACGSLDMAAVHLGQNLPDATRSRHAARGAKVEQRHRPDAQDAP